MAKQPPLDPPDRRPCSVCDREVCWRCNGSGEVTTVIGGVRMDGAPCDECDGEGTVEPEDAVLCRRCCEQERASRAEDAREWDEGSAWDE